MDLLRAFGITRDARAAQDARPSPAQRVLPPARERAARAALNLDAVFRSVQVIQTAASQLTLDAWRGADLLTGEAYPRALAAPWEDADQTDLVTETVAALALRGNAYIRVVRDARDQVIGLRPLAPLECVPTLAPRSGARAVQWNGGVYGPSQILHLRLLRVPGEAEGLGPIQACKRLVDAAIDLSEYSANWLRTGGVPTGLLSTDATITAAQASEAAEMWNSSNSASSGVAVLGHGLRFQPLALKPEEIQFLESREFDSKAIARMFGIPPHLAMVGVSGSSLTYQNIQDADLSFIRWTEMSYLRPIEAGLSRVLNGRQSVRFNLDAFLRPDTRTRWETYKTGIDAGFIDAEWVRETEGLHTGKDTP